MFVAAQNGMNWTAVSIVGTLILSALGSMFGLYQARKADRSAQFTRSIEVGVTSLVDQLQEEREELRKELAAARQRSTDLETQLRATEKEIRELRKQIQNLMTALDNQEAEIIGYKRRLGELA